MISDHDYFMLHLSKNSEGCYLTVDCNSVFPVQQPLFLEIGSGKGEFISAYSILHPESNILGIEVAHKRLNNILKKLSPDKNPNVRLMRMFVDASIKDVFAPESISGVFIQHPDPWPKRKHHRRRLIQEDFLDALAHILKPEAQVQVSTDHAEYASWILEEFLANPCYISVYDDPLRMQSTFEDHITTWFEAEQRRQGFDPHFMLFKRI
ncbi:MAG: tRNA (guanosine(46)-N7)-methyltransferase TrmB [Candidatus Cloacimonetes bacterium HGW-Cloacimonetes-3]|nr:MAG: tRNA (guanosine(46)-N7)-methyltransferase TrmB [Candidatus Cloacimonetes bacterium HGW-Cloacimonetes-3]